MLVHRITDSSIPKRYSCRVPIVSNWNVELMDMFLLDYEDIEVVQWLRFGFSVI